MPTTGSRSARMSEPTHEEARRTLELALSLEDEYIDFVSALARVESPTHHPETQTDVHALLVPAFEDLGFDVRTVRGELTGDHLLARPKRRVRSAPIQLLVGHTDTVWPLDTLSSMPVEVREGRLHGPGTLDMKGGVAMMIFAFRILRALDLEPELTPVLFLNADEETGSPDSRKWVRRLAKTANRALVLEPALGESGAIKTARKGVGRFDVTIHGRAAHAGLEPELGASAIEELSYVIRKLHALSDPGQGTTLNVGVVSGGTRPNVVAPFARATVDLRVTSIEAAREVEEAVRAIRAEVPGVKIEIEGGLRVPPLERTPRNQRLWRKARAAGSELGLEIDDALAGGGSDGNTTSMYTATLDGLGCVGDGAHADHEHIAIEPTLERLALLARLLLTPPEATDA